MPWSTANCPDCVFANYSSGRAKGMEWAATQLEVEFLVNGGKEPRSRSPETMANGSGGINWAKVDKVGYVNS